MEFQKTYYATLRFTAKSVLPWQQATDVTVNG